MWNSQILQARLFGERAINSLPLLRGLYMSAPLFFPIFPPRLLWFQPSEALMCSSLKHACVKSECYLWWFRCSTYYYFKGRDLGRSLTLLYFWGHSIFHICLQWPYPLPLLCTRIFRCWGIVFQELWSYLFSIPETYKNNSKFYGQEYQMPQNILPPSYSTGALKVLG